MQYNLFYNAFVINHAKRKFIGIDFGIIHLLLRFIQLTNYMVLFIRIIHGFGKISVGAGVLKRNKNNSNSNSNYNKSKYVYFFHYVFKWLI